MKIRRKRPARWLVVRSLLGSHAAHCTNYHAEWTRSPAPLGLIPEHCASEVRRPRGHGGWSRCRRVGRPNFTTDVLGPLQVHVWPVAQQPRARTAAA